MKPEPFSLESANSKNHSPLLNHQEANLEGELEKLKSANKKLQADLQKEKQGKAKAEEDLAKEVKRAAGLDQKLNQSWDNQKSLTEELEKTKVVERENGQLKKEIEDLVAQLTEKEDIVFDLATELGRSKVKVDSLTKYKVGDEQNKKISLFLFDSQVFSLSLLTRI